MKYDMADKWLKNRMQMPTALSSKGLEGVAPAIKAMSFFSARVAQGHVLDRLREVSDAYTRGELDLATARLKLKNAFGTKYEPGSEEDSQMERLCSTARLNLILRQNARMAMAVGEYQQGMDEDMKAMFPYWRYVASTSASPRSEHQKYAGKVFSKEDKIWQHIFPPWDFNCKCSVEEVAADEVEPEEVEPHPEWDDEKDAPKSGYVFNPADALGTYDPSLIKDEELRDNVVKEMKGKYACVSKVEPDTDHTVLQMLANNESNDSNGANDGNGCNVSNGYDESDDVVKGSVPVQKQKEHRQMSFMLKNNNTDPNDNEEKAKAMAVMTDMLNKLNTPYTYTKPSSVKYISKENDRPGKLTNRYIDPVSGEIREDVKSYVDILTQKGESTTNDLKKIQRQRELDYTLKPVESKMACDAYNKLSEGEKHSLDAYTCRDPYKLNYSARVNKKLDEVQHRENDRLISVLNKLPVYHGDVYRGIGLSKTQWEEFINKLQQGENPLVGFLSTSWNYKKAYDYAQNSQQEVRVLLIFTQSSRGHFLGPISCTPDDMEVLYAPNQSFKLTKVTQGKDNFFKVILKEV